MYCYKSFSWNKKYRYICYKPMSRKELKEFLHQRIDEVESDELLERVKFFLEINTGLEEPYTLTKAERSAVQEGLEDYCKGKTTSHEDFKKEMRGWEKS